MACLKMRNFSVHRLHEVPESLEKSDTQKFCELSGSPCTPCTTTNNQGLSDQAPAYVALCSYESKPSSRYSVSLCEQKLLPIETRRRCALRCLDFKIRKSLIKSPWCRRAQIIERDLVEVREHIAFLEQDLNELLGER